jgi:hypothetical protein
VGGEDQRRAPRGPSCEIGSYERWTVSITSGPNRYTKHPNATLRFAASDPAASYRCRLSPDQSRYSPCDSPKSYSGLAEGTHHFRVFALAHGVRSLTAARTWTVDATRPTATIDAGPTGTSGPDVSFDFSGTDPGSGIRGFSCRLDGGSWAACDSPKDYTGLAPGPHRFRVRSIDRAGNRSTRVRRDWTVVGS